MDALELVDENKVCRLFTLEGGTLFSVGNSKSSAYIVFPSARYCPCPSFIHLQSGLYPIFCWFNVLILIDGLMVKWHRSTVLI